MVLTVDQQRVKSLIQETITLLCKNGLNYNDEFTIEALIGITIDKDNVFLVTINDSVQSDKPKSPTPPPVQKSPSPKPAAENSYSVHRERKRQRESAQNDTSRDDTNLSYDDDSYRVPGSSNQGYTGNHEDDEPPLNKRPNYSNVKQEKEDSNDSDLVMVKEEPGEGGGGDYNYGAQYSEHSQSSMYNTGAGFSDQWPPGTDAKSMQQQQFQGASFGGSQAGYSPSPSGGGGGGGQPGQVPRTKRKNARAAKSEKLETSQSSSRALAKPRKKRVAAKAKASTLVAGQAEPRDASILKRSSSDVQRGRRPKRILSEQERERRRAYDREYHKRKSADPEYRKKEAERVRKYHAKLKKTPLTGAKREEFLARKALQSRMWYARKKIKAEMESVTTETN